MNSIAITGVTAVAHAEGYVPHAILVGMTPTGWKTKRKMKMKNSRKKGNSYELEVIKRFVDKGWVNAVSSRSESKRTDDAGVDICYLPVNVQCKAVERLGSIHKILDSMPNGEDNVVFHKRNRQGTVVSMGEDLFFKLLVHYYRHELE